MSQPSIRWIVTANFTADGSVAYRREDGSWSSQLSEAGLHPDEASAQVFASQAAAQEQALVCDPYPIDMGWDGETLRPLTARESIRAQGPTVPYGYVKQRTLAS